jgi:hypothetical protein
VLATKFFGNHILPHAKEGTILSNYGRNSSKALLSTVHNSLTKLRTNYLGHSLRALIGLRDFACEADDLAEPARGHWNRLVSRPKRYASLVRSKVKFIHAAVQHGAVCNLQGVLERCGLHDGTRDMVMCEVEQMAVAP